MARVKMYSTRSCPYCRAARELLTRLGADYEDIDVSGKPELRAEMERLSGRRTVPQIWIGERHIGGFDDMNALQRKGQLEALLAAAAQAEQ